MVGTPGPSARAAKCEAALEKLYSFFAFGFLWVGLAKKSKKTNDKKSLSPFWPQNPPRPRLSKEGAPTRKAPLLNAVAACGMTEERYALCGARLYVWRHHAWFVCVCRLECLLEEQHK
jgi:hypothetical protein